MRRFTVCAIAAGLLCLLPSAALAQAKTGDSEVLVFGNLTSSFGDKANSGSAVTTGFVLLNYGKFTSDLMEIGGGPLFIISTSAGNTTTIVGANGFVRRYFKTQNPKVAPYFGGDVAVPDFNPSSGNVLDGLTTQASFGVKNYVSEKAAIDMKGTFGILPKHASRITVGFQVGLTVIF